LRDADVRSAGLYATNRLPPIPQQKQPRQLPAVAVAGTSGFSQTPLFSSHPICRLVFAGRLSQTV